MSSQTVPGDAAAAIAGATIAIVLSDHAGSDSARLAALRDALARHGVTSLTDPLPTTMQPHPRRVGVTTGAPPCPCCAEDDWCLQAIADDLAGLDEVPHIVWGAGGAER